MFTPWNKGKTGVYSVETLQKMSLAKMGKSAWNKGKQYTIPVSQQEGHWNWKGGRQANNHRYKLKKRLEILSFLGNKCVGCGFADFRALQIDHIKGGGRKEYKAIGYTTMLKKVYEHPEEYQLLCANCNWIKRYENREFANIRQ